jgi:hypothetical protein
LNSSKQAHAPHCARPLKNLAMNCRRQHSSRYANMFHAAPQLWYAVDHQVVAASNLEYFLVLLPSGKLLSTFTSQQSPRCRIPCTQCDHLVVQPLSAVEHHALHTQRLPKVLHCLCLASACRTSRVQLPCGLCRITHSSVMTLLPHAISKCTSRPHHP